MALLRAIVKYLVSFFNFLPCSVKMATKKQLLMEWADDHDILLLREMIASSRKAVQTVAKSGSQSRKDWTSSIIQNLW